VRQNARGQAIAETVIFLPIALLTLFGVIWASQYSVMSERVQSAVRYSGLIANQLNPFMEYSMFVLYNSMGTASLNVAIPTQTCNPPTTDALTNSNTYPGPTSGPFWQNTPAPPTVTCSSTPSQKAVFSSGVTQTSLALSNTPIVQTGAAVPSYLNNSMVFGQVIAGGSSPTTASLNFMKPADMPTLLNCQPAMQTTIGASLAPTTPPLSPTVFPTPIAATMPTVTPIPQTCS
jgi:hypothetical protein